MPHTHSLTVIDEVQSWIKCNYEIVILFVCNYFVVNVTTVKEQMRKVWLNQNKGGERKESWKSVKNNVSEKMQRQIRRKKRFREKKWRDIETFYAICGRKETERETAWMTWAKWWNKEAERKTGGNKKTMKWKRL